MALLILALLQRIFLMSSLMLLLVWLIFFIDRKSGSAGMPRPISYAVFCLKKKKVAVTLQVRAPRLATEGRDDGSALDAHRGDGLPLLYSPGDIPRAQR